MKYECELIQDLIPLVKDGVANSKSKNAVLQHIGECSACNDFFQTDEKIALSSVTETENMERMKAINYRDRIKKRRKIVGVSFISLVVILIAVIGLFTAYVIMLLAGTTGESYTSRNIAEYGDYSGHIEVEEEGFFSTLEIFPKEIPQSAEVKDYYYFCNNGGLDNSYQLYLVCSYGEEDFALEKERLQSIEFAFFGEVHKAIVTDTGFNYPAVVTMFNEQNSYEYALIDAETRTIVYIFAQSMGIDKEIVPSGYHPKGFKPPEEQLTTWGSFNLYLFKVDDGLPGDTYINPGKDNISE